MPACNTAVNKSHHSTAHPLGLADTGGLRGPAALAWLRPSNPAGHSPRFTNGQDSVDRQTSLNLAGAAGPVNFEAVDDR